MVTVLRLTSIISHLFSVISQKGKGSKNRDDLPSALLNSTPSNDCNWEWDIKMGPKVLSYPCWTVRTILVRRKVAANSPFSRSQIGWRRLPSTRMLMSDSDMRKTWLKYNESSDWIGLVGKIHSPPSPVLIPSQLVTCK